METKNEAVTYDYKTVRVKRDMEAMTADAYENLGWQLVGSGVAEGAIFDRNVSFKRDRKIANKQNLLKIQEKVDSTLANIEVLKNKKKSAGTASSLATGIAGALTLGGGMSLIMVIETTAAIIGGVALGVVGLGICALAWLVYKRVRKNKLSKIEPSLEDEYNKLADICEEAR